MFEDSFNPFHEFDIDLKLVIQVLIFVTRVVEDGDGLGALDGSVDVLSEIVEANEVPPALAVDIVPRDVLARVLLAATDNSRSKRL